MEKWLLNSFFRKSRNRSSLVCLPKRNQKFALPTGFGYDFFRLSYRQISNVCREDAKCVCLSAQMAPPNFPYRRYDFPGVSGSTDVSEFRQISRIVAISELEPRNGSPLSGFRAARSRARRPTSAGQRGPGPSSPATEATTSSRTAFRVKSDGGLYGKRGAAGGRGGPTARCRAAFAGWPTLDIYAECGPAKR